MASGFRCEMLNIQFMTDFLDLELEDTVTDMNLEARLEKELLLHGYQRRDLTDAQIAYLRSALRASAGEASLDSAFWEDVASNVKQEETPAIEPQARFAVGDRVWVTESVSVNGVPGVGVVRKVEKEWIDLGEELRGYWEISYQLRNLRTTFTEDHVFASELEALAALAADFRKQAITQASEACKRMRALGMGITTKELLENVALAAGGGLAQ